MIREALASVARNESLGGVLGRTPVARDLVSRVVGGESLDEVLPLVSDLADRGYFAALERVAPDVQSGVEAQEAAAGYAEVIDAVAASGLAGVAEVVLFPESLGQVLDRGADTAYERLDALAAQGSATGVPLRLGIADPTDLAEALTWVDPLLARGDDLGVTLPAILRSTEADCVRLADHRVRLVKGARGDGTETYRQPIETDKAFVRCAKTLLQGGGEPSFATHDTRLIEIVESLADRYGRAPHSFEFAFYLGRQTGQQERLLAAGHRVRVYVPFGPRWFERLVGGLAEQPGGIGGALRSLLPG